MTDAFLGYSAWCKTQSPRPMGVDEFVDAMDKCCKQFGIRKAVESNAHCLLDNFYQRQPLGKDGGTP